MPFVVETGGRIHRASMDSIRDIAGRAIKEKLSRLQLEGLDVEAEVETQCNKLFSKIGDEVAKSACLMMASFVGDLTRAKQRRVMQHQVHAVVGSGGSDDC